MVNTDTHTCTEPICLRREMDLWPVPFPPPFSHSDLISFYKRKSLLDIPRLTMAVPGCKSSWSVSFRRCSFGERFPCYKVEKASERCLCFISQLLSPLYPHLPLDWLVLINIKCT